MYQDLENLESSQVKIHIEGLPQYGIARPGSLMASHNAVEPPPIKVQSRPMPELQALPEQECDLESLASMSDRSNSGATPLGQNLDYFMKREEPKVNNLTNKQQNHHNF